jgi:hypothetical protein
LVSTSEVFFGKAITILKKLLSVSKYAKALEHMSIVEAFRGFPEKDMQFLRSVIFFMNSIRNIFISECSKQFTEEEDEKIFARKFCSLLITLCANYEIFLIEKSENSQSLFTLLKDCAESKNLRIAIQSLEFWY